MNTLDNLHSDVGQPQKGEMSSSSLSFLDQDELASCRSSNSAGMSLSFVTDDENSISQTSLANVIYKFDMDEEVSTACGFDEAVLSDLIGKLRGASPSEPDMHCVDDEDSDDNMTDDLITKHLKALSQGTTVEHIAGEEASETEGMSYSEGDDISLMTYATSAIDGDSSDDETVDHEAYANVEKFRKKMGVIENPTTEEDVELEEIDNHREWLENVTKQGNLDYDGAPQTIATKKDWLVQLASELLEESSDDDEPEEIVEYESNMDELAREAELGRQLIANTEELYDEIPVPVEAQCEPRLAPVSRPKAEQQSALKPTASSKIPTAAEMLLKKAELGQRERGTASTLQQHSVPTPQTAKRVDGSINTRSTKVHNGSSQQMMALKRTVEAAQRRAQERRQKEMLQNRPSQQMIALKRTVEAAQRRAHARRQEELRQEALARAVAHLKKVQLVKAANPNERKVGAVEKSSPVTQPMLTKIDQKVKSAPAKPRQSNVLQKNLSDVVKTATKERAQKASESKKSVGSIVIPSGLPPYPGFGPKWPWHPNSPKAPEGYKECYMKHMGHFYCHYMEYLKTRASTDSEEETKTEEIMRASLSNQASFKSVGNSKKKAPAVPPTTFAAKPGRARAISVVPVVLPKIEEGSNSSSGSSVPKAKDMVERKKTQPDVVVKGKCHKKSNGKRGKIIIVSGDELDQMARDVRKNADKNKDTKASKKGPEQASDVSDQQCACIVM